jgi:hypothetical protein
VQDQEDRRVSSTITANLKKSLLAPLSSPATSPEPSTEAIQPPITKTIIDHHVRLHEIIKLAEKLLRGASVDEQQGSRLGKSHTRNGGSD